MAAIDFADWRAYYSNLETAKQIEHLAVLGRNLTVCAREAYPSAGDQWTAEERFRHFQGVNEVFHVLTFQMVALIRGWKERYPDSAFCNAVMESADMYQITGATEWAIGKAVSDMKVRG